MNNSKTLEFSHPFKLFNLKTDAFIVLNQLFFGGNYQRIRKNDVFLKNLHCKCLSLVFCKLAWRPLLYQSRIRPSSGTQNQLGTRSRRSRRVIYLFFEIYFTKFPMFYRNGQYHKLQWRKISRFSCIRSFCPSVFQFLCPKPCAALPPCVVLLTAILRIKNRQAQLWQAVTSRVFVEISVGKV